MNIKKEIVEVFETFFWTSMKPQAAFRLTIVGIVIVAVAMAFMSEAKANTYADFDSMIIMAVHTTEEETSPPIMYNDISKNNLYIEESHPDEYCIALNVYYEARADNLAGKYAVADVVLNRVNDSRFPDTVCEVIREGIMVESWSTAQHKDLSDEERVYYPKRNRCQFSWYCDGMADVPTQKAAWRDAQIIAYNIVQFGTFRGITEGATHYHATYVSPSWSLVYQVIGRVGAHIFYRWV